MFNAKSFFANQNIYNFLLLKLLNFWANNCYLIHFYVASDSQVIHEILFQLLSKPCLNWDLKHCSFTEKQLNKRQTQDNQLIKIVQKLILNNK